MEKDNVKAKPTVSFYMAEDLRQEASGLITAIGLYPDRVLLMAVPDDVPEPTKTQPLALKSLGFMFNVTGLDKPVSIAIEMEADGERSVFMKKATYGPIETGRSINLIGMMSPCLVTSFGVKTLILNIGKNEYKFDFEIRKALIGTVSQPTAVKAPAKAGAKKTSGSRRSK